MKERKKKKRKEDLARRKSYRRRSLYVDKKSFLLLYYYYYFFFSFTCRHLNNEAPPSKFVTHYIIMRYSKVVGFLANYRVCKFDNSIIN